MGATNRRVTTAAATYNAWNQFKYTYNSNYKSTAPTSDSATSDKYGFAQYGVANCQNAGGLAETWVFPSTGTYTACYQKDESNAYVGKRIYQTGSTPATLAEDARTYLTVSLVIPTTSPASTFTVV